MDGAEARLVGGGIGATRETGTPRKYGERGKLVVTGYLSWRVVVLQSRIEEVGSVEPYRDADGTGCHFREMCEYDTRCVERERYD